MFGHIRHALSLEQLFRDTTFCPDGTGHEIIRLVDFSFLFQNLAINIFRGEVYKQLL